MRIDILTLFPDICNAFCKESILGRGQKNGHIEIVCHNIRDFSDNKHNRVDDYPYGGGPGMLMSAEPICACFESICNTLGKKPHLIYMSPKGKRFDQKSAFSYSKMSNIALLCGHYEGVDQRVLDLLVDEEISIGDYVCTGGELAALVFTDAVCRLVDGVLSGAESYEKESFSDGLLEYPQYTRPEVWRGMPVPEILLSGHHANIESWRGSQSLELTKKLRPDLLEGEK